MCPQTMMRRQPPGTMVDIGGLRLHALVCGQGAPAVILEPALGGFALQYAHIQSALSETTQVMAYDRAGQGWSDASPNPRLPAALAAELRALLDRLDLLPPYLLVGHSFGGMLSRVYAGLHPEETAGVVLLDATHVDEYAPFPNLDKMIGQMAGMVRLMKFLARLGLGRAVARLSLGPTAKTLSPDDLRTFIDVTSRPGHHETMLAEYAQHRRYFGAHSEVPRALGDIPLLVITAGNSVSGRAKIGGALTGDEMNEFHQRLQKDLVKLSTRGEQVIVPGATHLSLLLQPEYAAQVVEAIRGMLERVRREPLPG